MNKPATRETLMPREIAHYVAGSEVRGASGRFADVYNPATGEISGKVPLAGEAEVSAAIEAAQRAFPAWAATPPLKRARVMFKFKELIERDVIFPLCHPDLYAEYSQNGARSLSRILACAWLRIRFFSS